MNGVIYRIIPRQFSSFMSYFRSCNATYMYMYMYIYIYIYIYMYVYVHVYMYVHIHEGGAAYIEHGVWFTMNS